MKILILLSGLALPILLVGTLVLVHTNEFNSFIEDKIIELSFLLIVIGIVAFLIAFIGCLGVFKKSPILLNTYATLLAAIFIIELAVGIAAIGFRYNLEMAINDRLVVTLKRSNDFDLKAWDNIQKKLMCCGVSDTSGVLDWRYLSRDKTLRPSCCRAEYVDADTGDCQHVYINEKDRYYQDGCLYKLKDLIKNNSLILIGVGIGIAFIQLLGIYLAYSLASSIRKKRENNFIF